MKYQELERCLSNLYGYSHAVLVGRARSGLFALGEVLGLAGMDAVIPSNLCPVVPAAFSNAGLSVRLAQVSAKNGLAEDNSLIDSMSSSTKPGLVMPTHIYGHWRSYSETQKWAKKNGWFILENDTLCAARKRMGRRLAFGDALLVSFGHAKSINAGGGGALLTDDFELANNLRRLIAKWPEINKLTNEKEENLIKVRRYLRQLGRSDLGEKLLEVDQSLMCYSFSPSLLSKVMSEIEQLESNMAMRAEVSECWNQILKPIEHVVCPVLTEVTAPWRMIRTVKEPLLRDLIVKTMRAEGFDVGTNFPSLTENYPVMLGSQSGFEANIWSAITINFWLEETYTPSRIQSAVTCIKKIIDTNDVGALHNA